jgi:hypothetical protein
MITFGQFLEHKHNDLVVKECTHLMVEMEIDPYVYIYESLKEIDPVLAEGWWDGVKQFAGNAWNAAKQVGKGVWDGGGLKHGLRQAADTLAGPVAKFDAAERALGDLVKLLNNDERFQDKFKSSTGQGSVGQYLAGVLESLKKDKESVPQMMNAQVKQDYGTRKDVDDQNSAAAAAKAGGAAQPAPTQAAPQTNQPAQKRSWETRMSGQG